MSFVAWAVGRAHISANLSESRRSVPALHLFRAVQTETVRLHINASASFESLWLALMVRAPARSVAGSHKLEKAQRSLCGDGLLVEAPRAALHRFPKIPLCGPAGYSRPPKVPTASATVDSADSPQPAPASFQSVATRYENPIDTFALELPH